MYLLLECGLNLYKDYFPIFILYIYIYILFYYVYP